MANVPISNMTATWTDSGTTYTGIKMNVTDTASAAGSLLADLQVGGTSRFQVRKAGSMSLVTDIGTMVVGTDGTNNYTIQAYQGATKVGRIGFNEISNNIVIAPYGNTTTLFAGSISIGNGAAADLILARDAANTLAQRNATNAQTLRVYRSYTDASNYSRLAINNNQIASEAAGTGTLEVTADAPVLNLAQTWNNAAVTFTGLKFNATDTASASASLLADLQVGGSSKISVRKDGSVNIASSLYGGNGAAPIWAITGAGLVLSSARTVSWSSSGTFGAFSSGTSDLYLARDAADTLAQRNATNAQTFNIYNTYTSSTNYERGFLKWNTNVLRIGTEKGSGGGTARALDLQTDATTRLTIGASGGVTIADANDVAVGTTTGTKIGTATSQKLGFWNATPIVQPTTAVAEATFVENSGGTAVNVDSTFDGYTLQQVVKALRDAGLLA